jgi:hypothetical protein
MEKYKIETVDIESTHVAAVAVGATAKLLRLFKRNDTPGEMVWGAATKAWIAVWLPAIVLRLKRNREILQMQVENSTSQLNQRFKCLLLPCTPRRPCRRCPGQHSLPYRYNITSRGVLIPSLVINVDYRILRLPSAISVLPSLE